MFFGRTLRNYVDLGEHGDSGEWSQLTICQQLVNGLKTLHCNMAEREGFEPPVPLRVRLISSQVHSTGLCHLSALGYCDLPSRDSHRVMAEDGGPGNLVPEVRCGWRNVGPSMRIPYRVAKVETQ